MDIGNYTKGTHMQKLTVIRPAHAHHAYEIAAETFADLAIKVAKNSLSSASFTKKNVNA